MRERLRRERQLAGLSQAQLARQIGLSQQTVSKHELGLKAPQHFSVIRQYERILKVSADALFPDIFAE
jgi:transcriptional regulator with XRE-family HTH domain